MEGSLGDTTIMGDMESLDTRRGERERWGDPGERIDEWLCDAAMRGDVESLKKIITIDGYILDKVLVGSFKGKNPLHLAILCSSKAATEFVQELLDKKRDLAEVFDKELGTALHVASAKGHLEAVKLLVKPELCLTRDRDGNNPLHIAAMKGKAEVLKELVQSSLHRAQVRTDRGDTILHLCVKYNHFNCLKQLLDMFPDQKFANAADTDGNTILHLAVFEKNLEMVESLVKYKALGRDSPLMNVNAVNKSGRTALDIFVALKSIAGNPTDSKIEDLLRNARARRLEHHFIEVEEPKWMSKRRNTIMIVCSLVATMAFQVGVNPPSGVWLDSSADHKVGKSILAYNYPYSYSNFMYVNTLGFLMSLSTIFVLILSLPEPTGTARTIRGFISWLIIMAMAYSYTFAVVGISPKGPEKQGTSVSFGVVTMAILWAVMMTPLLRKVWFERVMEMIYGGRDRPRPHTPRLLISCSCSVRTDGENRSPV